MSEFDENANCEQPSKTEAKDVLGRKGWLRKFVRLCMASYLAVVAYFWWIQDQAIFKPLSVDEARSMRPDDFPTPSDWGLEDMTFPSRQRGKPLRGLWLPAGNGAPVALYLHGQEVTRYNNLHHAKCLNDLGCSVLVIDYRGYGELSDEAPSEASVCEDAESAWEYLTKSLGIAPERILIYGHSLGGAIAIQLASKHNDAGGLVAESTFTSIKDMARRRNYLAQILPLGLLLHHEFDSLKTVQEAVLPPALFVHGADDSKVPTDMCEKLYAEAAFAEFKRKLVLSGGEHACRKKGQQKYEEAMGAFLTECFRIQPKTNVEAGID